MVAILSPYWMVKIIIVATPNSTWAHDNSTGKGVVFEDSFSYQPISFIREENHLAAIVHKFLLHLTGSIGSLV